MEKTRTGTSVAVRMLDLLVVLGVLSIPFALIGSGLSAIGQGKDETLHTLLRLAALLAISFIFLQIMTGAFRPQLRRYFNARRLQSAHVAFGLTGFGLAIGHFLLLIPSFWEHWDVLDHGFFVLGPVALGLLLLTVSTALLMRKMPHIWNKIHVLNYGVFAVGIVHSLAIGTQGTLLTTRIVFGIYAVLVLAGLGYRASQPEWRRRVLPVAIRADGN